MGCLQKGLRHMCTPAAVVDIFGVIPFYISLLFGSESRFVGLIRLVRVVRLMKLRSITEQFKILASVLRSDAPRLIGLTFLIGAVVVFGGIMLYEVNDDEPAFSTAGRSIYVVFGLFMADFPSWDTYNNLSRSILLVIGVIALFLVALITGAVAGSFLEANTQYRTQEKEFVAQKKNNLSAEQEVDFSFKIPVVGSN